MPCELCGTNVVRNHTHSRTAQHRKLLFDKFKKMKAISISKYGIFIIK